MLAKARALRGELTPLTAGTPPAGENFGISAAAVTALGARVATYEAEMGRPSDARSDKKAMTAQLRPRYAELRALLADIDGLMPMLRDRSEAHTLFVDSYFNARRIGGHAGEEDEGGNGNTPPPKPPTS